MLKKIAVLALGVALCAPAMAGHKHYKKCHMTQRTGYVVVTKPVVMEEVIVRPSIVREQVIVVKPVRYTKGYSKVVVMKPYGEFGYRYPRVVYYY